MKRQCRESGAWFEVADEDLEFLEKLSPVIGGHRYPLPVPTLCPAERQRRRLSFRNERKWYHRKSSLSGREIISVYPPEHAAPVYSQDEWWSDKWDPLAYGQDVDFSRPFFEQFAELLPKVPCLALINRNGENSDYANICADNKNCYVLIESSNNEECHYSYWMQKCRSCIDCSFCYECELCYEISDCTNCYNLQNSRNCRGCSDGAYLYNCTGCRSCFGSTNLVHKEFYFFNEPCSREEYLARVAALGLGGVRARGSLRDLAEAHFLKFPRRYAEISNSEGCTGSFIVDSKNCRFVFHTHDAQDCAYAVHAWRDAKDNLDVDTVGRHAERNYECINTGIDVIGNLFCARVWSCSDLLYCMSCDYSANCFGCAGLRHHQYCILNKQYSKDDYHALVQRLIERMMETPYPGAACSAELDLAAHEWGEFFPSALSPFGYNETVANEFFPLEEAAARRRGFAWRAEQPFPRYEGKEYHAPDDIGEVGDDVLQPVLRCAGSGKPYRVIAQELAFYRANGIPLPRYSPDERHRRRMSLRDPRELSARECARCHKAVESSVPPDSRAIIYCEECFSAALV